jgi:hypothetical protein
MKIKQQDLNNIIKTDQPVPTISDNISIFITEKLKEENYDFLIEYGSGNSTRYFLSKLLKFEKQCTYISVEYHPGWFKELVKLIKLDFNAAFTSEEQFELRSWNYEKCKIFLHGKNASPLNIPSELKRLPKAKRAFGGLFNIKMLLHRMRKESRPIDGDYSVTIEDSIKLHLFLRSQMMKDQYGESPIKEEYISAALIPVTQSLTSKKDLRVVFLIDGGPRSDILNSILDLEERNKNFVPTIFMCDANRSFYSHEISRRPNGVFLKGSNRTLNDELLYKDIYDSKKANFWFDKENVSSNELMEKEVWFYQAKSKKG